MDQRGRWAFFRMALGVAAVFVGVVACGESPPTGVRVESTVLSLTDSLARPIPGLPASVYETNGQCTVTISWASCWCPMGMAATSWVQIYPDQGTYDDFTCACKNGSDNADCSIDPGGGGGGGGEGGEGTGHGGGGSGQGWLSPFDSFYVELKCDKGVARTSNGGCELDYSPATAPITNLQWEFLHTDITPTQTGSTTWSGKVVAPGQVTLTFDLDGSSTTYRDNLTVTPRAGWSASWGFTSDGVVPAQNDLHLTAPLTYSGVSVLGFWCRDPNCTPLMPFLRPYAPGDAGGFETDSVTDAGPNSGVHFIKSVNYWSDAASAIHSQLRSNSGTGIAGMTTCNNMNWYDGNVCQGTSTSTLSSRLTCVENHEGRGSATGGGHQKTAEAIAGGYDPSPLLELLTAGSQVDLEGDADGIVSALRSSIETDINQQSEPTGNCGSQTFWFPNGSTWAQKSISGGEE